MKPPPNYYYTEHWLQFKDYVYRNFYQRECWVNCFHTGQIQLHHISYANLWNESYTDVVPLCDTCHKMVHFIEKKGVRLVVAHEAVKKHYDRVYDRYLDHLLLTN